MKNNFTSFAGTMVLAGSLLSTFLYPNTSVSIQNITIKPNNSYVLEYTSYNTSKMIQNYSLPNQKFEVEKEAESLFGNMRMATLEEQKQITNCLNSISKPIGVNFWDLCGKNC